MLALPCTPPHEFSHIVQHLANYRLMGEACGQQDSGRSHFHIGVKCAVASWPLMSPCALDMGDVEAERNF